MSRTDPNASQGALIAEFLHQGAVLVQQGHLKAAETAYSHAIALVPSSRDAWYRRGIVRAMLGSPEASARDVGHAEQLAAQRSMSRTSPQTLSTSRWAPAVA